MDSPSPVPDPVLKTVTEKLERGKDSAIQLQALIQKACGDGGSPLLVEEQILQILRSFTESITHLTSSCGDVNGLSQIAAADGPKRVPPVDRSSKVSDRSKKRPGVKDRRGCYRRRNSAQSWVEVSPTSEDGHAWRKYGQKDILNSKFPRCYFRCTHKHDQGCKATKQVQRIKDDPLVYQTTYFGLHTCQNTLVRTPQIITEPDPMESCLLSFQTKTTVPKLPRPISQTVNQELKDETQSDVTDSKSCLDPSMWQDMMTSESSGTQKLEPSHPYRRVYNDQEAVSSFQQSCSSTPLQHHHDLDMEAFGTNFADLEPDLYLDGMEFDHLPPFSN